MLGTGRNLMTDLSKSGDLVFKEHGVNGNF
jgi:hypothetical protein